MELQWLLSQALTYRYQMLSRMQMDCNYFLGYGNRNVKKLWALNIGEHIAYMRELWDSFPADGKPEWLSREEIDSLEKSMVEGTDLTKWRLSWYEGASTPAMIKRIYLYSENEETAKKTAEEFNIGKWIEVMKVA